ncbi:hypothetical protein GCM10023189_21590 [Nibrella saemangeumensis]|uniref:DUF1460 domain-containing protein n=1 Tax=Nibrella saemangeumensis TaxID=1084526 RepID=A0ABP8MTG0_9BACT
MAKTFGTLFLLFHLYFTAFSQEPIVSDIRQVTVTVGKTPAETAVTIGKTLIGRPYVAHTLDRSPEEKLVVNFREFDCTTFLETTLALALGWHELSDKQNLNQYDELFQKNLTRIRYRNGVINGYASRLHYFSEWLMDNERQGLIHDITGEIGGIQVSKPVSYMTACTWKYPKLSDSTVYRQIAQCEAAISQQSFWFIPKKQIRAIESRLKDGDIVMLTAARTGLDMKHVGFVVWQNGRPYLLHASSEYGEVMITKQPLADYVQANKSFSGIRVARLNEQVPAMSARAQ